MEAFKRAEILQNTLNKYTYHRHEEHEYCKGYYLCLELYFTDIKSVKPYLTYAHLFQIHNNISLT